MDTVVLNVYNLLQFAVVESKDEEECWWSVLIASRHHPKTLGTPLYICYHYPSHHDDDVCTTTG